MIDVWICWVYLHLDFAAIFRETNPPNAIHQNLKVFLVDGLHPTSSVTHSNSPPIYQQTYQPHQPWEIPRVFLYNQNCLEKTWKFLGKKDQQNPSLQGILLIIHGWWQTNPTDGMKMMWVVYGCLKGSKMGFRMFSLQQSNCLLDPSSLKYCLVKMRWLSDTAQNFTPMYE